MTEFPLSYAQQGLWLAHELRPDDSSYHIVKAYRLVGDVDVSALRRGLDALVDRHEILRTTYTLTDDGPVQRVGAPTRMMFDEAEPVDPREFLAEFARRQFDLEHGPVIRAVLARHGPRDAVFALCLHHVAGDAASVGVLTRELTQLYTAYRADRRPKLATPRQFREVATEQRARLRGEQLARLTTFWRNELADPPVPLLPAAAVPAPGRPAQIHSATVRPVAVAELVAEAREHGVTPYMVLLAAYARALATEFGRDEVLVGMPVASRPTPADEHVVGCMVDMLLVRLTPGAVAWPDLLDQVCDRCLNAYEHHLPFEALMEHVRPSGRTRLGVPHDAVLGFQHGRSDDFRLPDITVTHEPLELDSVQVPVDFEAILDDDLTLTLRHDTSAIPVDSGARILDLILDQLPLIGNSIIR